MYLGQKITSVEGRYGRIFIPDINDTIANSLREYGEWAQCEIDILLKFISRGDVVIDGGACFGTHSRAFASKVGTEGKVLSFEPSPKNYDLLSKNASTSGVANISTFKLALGEVERTAVSVEVDPVNVGASKVNFISPGDAPAEVTVRVTTLDKLALERVDFIKLDLEGAELSALRGSIETLKRHRPVVFTEVNRVEDSAGVFQFMKQHGYFCYGVNSLAFNDQNFAGSKRDTFSGASENGFLFVHAARSSEFGPRIDALRLPPIETIDDIVLMMLRQKQYFSDYLPTVASALVLPIPEVLPKGQLNRHVEMLANEYERLLNDKETELEVLRGNNEGAYIVIRHICKELSGLSDDLRIQLEIQRHSIKIARKIGKFPFLLFFKLSPTYRRSRRNILRNADLARQIHEKFLAILQFGESSSATVPGEHVSETNTSAHIPSNNREIRDIEELTNALNIAQNLLRKPIRTSIERALAKLALKHFSWLSEKKKLRLQKSISKRELHLPSRLFSAQDKTIQATVGSVSASIPDAQDFGDLIPPIAPSEYDWQSLEPIGGIQAPDPVVDVIVPVYRGIDETMRCLFSVISNPQESPFRLIVVNDCSPDLALTQALRMLRERGLIELIENEDNQGFVLSCNIAMRLNPNRDVLLLNSDTVVYGNWLDRMLDRAKRDPSVGSLTPFSNNATICSYPKFCEDNIQALEVDGERIDQIAAEVNADAALVEVPTGVGFCMFVRRECLNKVGLFDEEKFGKGYGEENDLCQKIALSGWKNFLVPNVYVRHWGAVSFGESTNKRIEAACRTIDRLYPDYHRSVARFIETDAVLPLRSRIDEGRLALRSGRTPAGAHLFVTHDLGGGTETHVQELRLQLEANGEVVFFARPLSERPGYFYVVDPRGAAMPNLPVFFCGNETQEFIDFLRRIGVTHIHIHHLMGYGDNSPVFFERVAKAAVGVRVDFTAHDYFSICPRVTLIDGSGKYCGEPDETICQTCVELNGSRSVSSEKVNVESWRRHYRGLLDSVDTIFVPNRDVAERLSKYVNRNDIEVREHTTDSILVPSLLDTIDQEENGTDGGAKRRKIGIIGSIGPHKGSALIFETAKAAKKLSLPLDFLIIGHTDIDDKFKSLTNVSVTGRYKSDEIVQIVRDSSLDLVWLPSLWPETFCYTLTEAVAAGVQPVVFSLGAQADRVRDLGWGEIMPTALMDDPGGAARFLANCKIVPPGSQTRGKLIRYFEGPEVYYGRVQNAKG